MAIYLCSVNGCSLVRLLGLRLVEEVILLIVSVAFLQVTPLILHSSAVALSDALKTLLPSKELVLKMVKITNSKPLSKAVICAEVFEGNQSALHLANNQRVNGC